MCGIAGIHDPGRAPVAAGVVQSMADAISHRGPDDEGIFVEPGIGLANRRLAILDLSPAGHQPMTNEDGSLVIVYNGELYNYLELAPILRARGHRLVSRTDTEVILHAYEEWGQACVERFDGMFAFAIYDRVRRRLVLGRDRLGVKPLYWAEVGGRLLFGSEVKSLLAAGLQARASPEALVEYFTFQNVLTDRTLFEGVRMLPPGHLMVADAGGRRVTRYWDPQPQPQGGVSDQTWVAEIRAAFEAAVTRQLVSDAPLGGYLSGGMDSGSIVAVASRHIPRLATFTGGFDVSGASGLEAGFDERGEAEQVASAFRTEHYEMVLHAGDMAWALPRLVWHLEDLRVGMSYQNYYIARLASRFVKVSLAGTGGDELFAGYPWRYAVADGTGDFEARHYESWVRLVPDADRADFLSPEVARAAAHHDPREVHRGALAPSAGLDPLDRSLDFELRTFLHGLLVVEDRVSMAHSLEVRVPFLDNALVDLALRIPARQKVGGQEGADGEGGKRLLRQAMAGLLPDTILGRRKQGFSPPDGSWYRGETMGYIQRVLLQPRSLERGYFQPGYVRRVLDEHLTGRRNHRLLIWSLLSFEWWNRIFLDGESPSDPADAALPRVGAP